MKNFLNGIDTVLSLLNLLQSLPSSSLSHIILITIASVVASGLIAYLLPYFYSKKKSPKKINGLRKKESLKNKRHNRIGKKKVSSFKTRSK